MDCEPYSQTVNLVAVGKFKQVESTFDDFIVQDIFFNYTNAICWSTILIGYSVWFFRSDNMEKIEKICQKRALELFKLDPKEWGVNVHSLSGSIANLVAYTAITGPRGRIMGLDLYDGGHYSHGYHGNNDESNAASIMSLFFDTYSYKLNPTTGYIDYDELHRTAKVVKPKLIVAGTYHFW